MYFTINCSDGVNRKFQVTFCHANKACTCEIWWLTDVPTNELEYNFPNSKVKGCASHKHPETKSKLLLSRAIAQCAKTDNYVYAYGRALSLKRALRVLIDKFYNSDKVLELVNDELPFKFDNALFKAFMHELHVQCPHGYEVAQKLQKKADYNINEHWMV